jgi:hypothetical protein
MKSDHDTSPEYQRFEDVLRKFLSVPPDEMERKVKAEKKTKRKKRAKKPASRVSSDRTKP